MRSRGSGEQGGGPWPQSSPGSHGMRPAPSWPACRGGCGIQEEASGFQTPSRKKDSPPSENRNWRRNQGKRKPISSWGEEAQAGNPLTPMVESTRLPGTDSHVPGSHAHGEVQRRSCLEDAKSGKDTPWAANTLVAFHKGPKTVVLDLPGNMSIAGGGFPQPYQAAQLHLHWGSQHALEGSEHTVDGHRYAGELHVVHYNARFGSFKEAAREPGGLAVLAAFLQVGSEENEPYQRILEHLGAVSEEGEETFIDGFDVAQLLPKDLERYFRYNGSLTTPPCFQTVNWTIFNQTLRLSPEQISVLEDTLRGDDDQPLQGNFRLPQSLYGRTVLASFRMSQTARRAPLPGKEGPPTTPAPRGAPEEGGDEPAPGEDGGQPPSPPAEATGGDPGPSPEEGGNHSLGSGAAEQLGLTVRTGDVLAILFGALFGLTALAFLIYVHKHRRQNQRLDAQPGKPSVIYAPAASTEENAI